ncbi:MAG: phosphodiester glycosidase family protein [Ruminococcaceae bacterium]|nr:phosphodiester glycosidase family protein [Oscillospiraceae bacterium]
MTIFKKIISLITCSFCILLTLGFLLLILTGNNSSEVSAFAAVKNYGISDRYDNFISNSISSAAEGFIKIKKVYLLSDNDQVAPEPVQSNFGKAADPASLQWLIDTAHLQMDEQELLFSTETPILRNSEINYFLDDTIFAVTWKQVIDNAVYTISEVKIEHPSQFRRFLSGGTFGYERQFLTSQMASSVNAVVASAGDFYKYRGSGIVVYNGQVERFNMNDLDTCLIDDQGDFVFIKAREFQTKEDLQNYVDEHNIRFSLCFGPILVQDGKTCEPSHYVLGEINQKYARSAICQLGPLHYAMITANGEDYYYSFPNIHTFAKAISEMGIETAYTLDGGQTATIVMNDEVINHVSYGAERYISDIIYFATALPDINE